MSSFVADMIHELIPSFALFVSAASMIVFLIICGYIISLLFISLLIISDMRIIIYYLFRVPFFVQNPGIVGVHRTSGIFWARMLRHSFTLLSFSYCCFIIFSKKIQRNLCDLQGCAGVTDKLILLLH